ncbi:MAG: hypothetical protein JJE30_16205 [Desulfuromonadales bacterium]|nr:hypothetical protein [Desulfuromonadales bacterium]
MKKVLSTIVAAIAALSFSAVVFAADMPAGHPATPDMYAKPAVEKKEVKKVKKAKKAIKAKKAAPSAADTATTPTKVPAPAPVQQ